MLGIECSNRIGIHSDWDGSQGQPLGLMDHPHGLDGTLRLPTITQIAGITISLSHTAYSIGWTATSQGSVSPALEC